MIKRLRSKLLIICALAFLNSEKAIAQIDDVGAWFGVTLQKQITRELEGSLTEEIRFNHDVTTIDVIYTDAGLEYSISKKLKAGIHYRFINKNQPNYYSKRHRIYADLAYKEKFSQFTIGIRGRIQEQFTDIYSSETGKIPVWLFRGKLSVKYDLEKKYTPYLSAEMYYLLDDPKDIDNFISRFRYEAGFSYEFNRMHSINPYILLQHSIPVDFNELIYGISYTVAL